MHSALCFSKVISLPTVYPEAVGKASEFYLPIWEVVLKWEGKFFHWVICETTAMVTAGPGQSKKQFPLDLPHNEKMPSPWAMTCCIPRHPSWESDWNYIIYAISTHMLWQRHNADHNADPLENW